MRPDQAPKLKSTSEEFPLSSYFAEQKQRIVDAFNGDIYSSVICAGPTDDLSKSVPRTAVSSFRMARGVRVRGYNILVTGADNCPTRVWARAGYRNYRAGFIRSLKHLETNRSDYAAFDVDHAVSRGSVDKECVVELFLVPKEVNRAWGATTERLAAKKAREAVKIGTALRPMRTMHWGQVSKLLGISPPADFVTDTESPQRLATLLYEAGIRGFIAADVEADQIEELASGIEMWLGLEKFR